LPEYLIPVLVAVVPTVAAAVIGIFTYRAQKRTDRHVELRNLRIKAYEQYISAFRAWTTLSSWYEGARRQPEDIDEQKQAASGSYWMAYGSLFQIASDTVLEAVIDFHEFAWLWRTDLQGDDWDEEFKNRYTTMIIEMRKDAFEKTQLGEDRVKEHLPFDFSEGPTADRVAGTPEQSNA
jgi:hypothetical protein